MAPGVGAVFITSAFKVNPRWQKSERGRDEYGPYHLTNM
jgi:hypothetical protein